MGNLIFVTLSRLETRVIYTVFSPFSKTNEGSLSLRLYRNVSVSFFLVEFPFQLLYLYKQMA